MIHRARAVKIQSGSLIGQRIRDVFRFLLGRSHVECSVPLSNPDSLGEIERLLTGELRGILAGADRVHAEIVDAWKSRGVSPS